MVVLTANAFLVGCSDDTSNNINAPKNLREDLTLRVNNFPSELLRNDEKEKILTMLSEAHTINLIPDPLDLGGQIYGSNRSSLKIGKKLLTKDDFHMERNLVRVLLHESQHWEDLKSKRFSSIRNNSLNSDSDEFISKMALLEFFAYSEAYKLAQRFNQIDSRYLMPECAEFLPDGTMNFIDVTPEKFGFGRSLMSNHKVIHSMRNLTEMEKNHKFQSFVKHYKSNYKETSLYKDTYPIDCNWKYGFKGEFNKKTQVTPAA